MSETMKEKKALHNMEDEEKAEHEMREKEKCLENGEPGDEPNGNKNGGANRSRLQVIGDRAKTLTTKKSLIVIVLLCILLFIFFVVILALAVRVGYLTSAQNGQTCQTSECLRSASQLAGHLNASFDPCTDFWTFACGNWLQTNPLPENRGSLGVQDEMKDRVNWKLRHLIDLVPHDANVRNPEGKVKMFYSTCMNLKTMEYTTLAGLKTIINQIGGWKFLENWSQPGFERNDLLANLHTEYGVTPFFKITVEPDDMAPTSNIIKIFPSGLGLPSRNHYFKTPDTKYEDLYKTFMENFARQMDFVVAEAKRFASNMLGYERRIAEITPSPEAYRNPAKYYRRITVGELAAISPTLPWLHILQRYYPKAGVDELTEIAIFDEKYFKELSSVVSTTDDYTLYDYYMWQMTLKYAPHLPSDFRKLTNQFYQSLKGVEDVHKMAQDRWEFCLDLTNEYLGLALGSMYVKKFFRSSLIEKSEEIEALMANAFSNHVNSIPWTEDSKTNQMVRDKIKQMLSLRGYPDFILNSDSLSSFYNDYHVQGDFLQNLFNGQGFLRRQQQGIIGKPVNSETSWTVSPQEVAALYKYNGNHMVLAAGLLQLPVFDPASINAVKFGSFGTILGSQMFKAFDDKGILYQKLGVLEPWLVGQSAKTYERESTCLRERLGNETLYGSINTNANLSLGEAIADIAAVKFAFKAYKDTPELANSILPGLEHSNDQLFFISYAQSMCQNTRIENVIAHNDFSTSSPAQVRVMRTLRQLPEFSETFQCSSSSPMGSQHKCRLW